MTEEEWIVCKHPAPMMWYLHKKTAGDRRTWFGPPSRGTLPRKWRLFLAACCERVTPCLSSRGQELMGFISEVAERVPEQADRERVRNWFTGGGSSGESGMLWALQAHLPLAAGETRNLVGNYAYRTAGSGQEKEAAKQLALATEECAQCAFLRDIFGNPFCPGALLHGWLTDTVLALAKQMYETRDFGAMPILADALQDAGCDDASILDHCRGPGPHVRGCWVVDLILGKE